VWAYQSASSPLSPHAWRRPSRQGRGIPCPRTRGRDFRYASLPGPPCPRAHGGDVSTGNSWDPCPRAHGGDEVNQLFPPLSPRAWRRRTARRLAPRGVRPLSPRAWRRRAHSLATDCHFAPVPARMEETLAGNALISRAILPMRERHGSFRLRPNIGGVCSKSTPPPAWVAQVILHAGSVQIAVSPSRSPVVRRQSRPGVTKVRALRPLDPLAPFGASLHEHLEL
jgi:hypothetical protein